MIISKIYENKFCEDKTHFTKFIFIYPMNITDKNLGVTPTPRHVVLVHHKIHIQLYNKKKLTRVLAMWEQKNIES